MQNNRKNTDPGTALRSISIFRNDLVSNGLCAPRGRARRTRQVVATTLAAAMFPLSMGSALAQDYGAPPPPPDYGNQAPPSNYQPLGPEQLNQLVAPVALYPDSLVAQVMAAATYPAQVAGAEQFIQQSGNYPPEQLAEMANEQPWDPSVKSLVAFPSVVDNMNRNMDWTTQLGNAYYNQPQDVLNAVQVMRQRAYAAGNLRSNSQLAVSYDPGDIVIAPVSPTVVYVPYYNPWVVYGAPVPVYSGFYYGPPRGVAFGAGLAIGFGVGIAIGAFTHFAWGFHSWAPDWHSHAVFYNHNTYISRSVTVVNHGNYGGYDRAPGARAFNQQQAARFGGGGYGGGSRTVNNVTINRGGNTFNGGGNTYNRGGSTFNGGANAYNRGGNTNGGANPNFNRGGNTNGGGNPNFNRGGAAPGGVPNGASNYNRGGQQPYAGNPGYGRGTQPAPGGATAGSYRGGAAPGAQGGQAQYNRGAVGGAPQGQARPQQAPRAPRQQQPSEHAAPQKGGGGHEGGGHENHGGGGHDDHR